MRRPVFPVLLFRFLLSPGLLYIPLSAQSFQLGDPRCPYSFTPSLTVRASNVQTENAPFVIRLFNGRGYDGHGCKALDSSLTCPMRMSSPPDTS